MKLTDTKIRNAKPGEKAYRLADGGGLYLRVGPKPKDVTAKEVRSWQLDYRLGGREQTFTFEGRYPAMTLADAREAARVARDKVAKGVHLTTDKRTAKVAKAASQALTAEALADDWVEDEAKRQKWSADHKSKVTASIKNHLLDPKHGRGLRGVPVDAITAAVCAPIFRVAEAEAPVLALKVRQRLHSMLDKAVEDGLIAVNPLPKTRRGAKAEKKKYPAVLDHKGVGEILRAADAAQTRAVGIKRAHYLCAFTVQRIGTVVAAKWSAFDLDTGTWTVERDEMKKKEQERGAHVVPIPPSLLRRLKEWKRDDGERATWVCRSERGDGPVTSNGVELFYSRRLGLAGKHVPHSWRSAFSTWANDAGESSDDVEAQLDHVKSDAVRAAYDRSLRLERRRILMAKHEERLIAARDGAQVVSIPRRQA